MASRPLRCIPLGLLLTVVALAGCESERATAPAIRAPLDVAYLDNLYRLTVVRVDDGAPVSRRTSVSGALPLAAADGALLFPGEGGALMRLAIADAEAAPVPVAPLDPRRPVALSADGRTLAWAAVGDGGVFVYFADTETGARDSLDLYPTTEPVTLLRILDAIPALSPDGGRVGFLLRSTLAMSFVVVHRADLRPEIRLLDASVGAAAVIAGRPRWLANDALRFATMLRSATGEATDSVGVVELRPFHGEPARLVYAAAPPPALRVDGARDYSLSADGDAIALTLTANGRDGVFLLRRGDAEVQPLVFGEGLSPRYPIVVPPRVP